MAARLRLRHQDEVRQKIQASNLITRLQKHADGEVEMTPTQVQAAKILLDKSIGNAAQEMIHTGDEENPIAYEKIVREVVKP